MAGDLKGSLAILKVASEENLYTKLIGQLAKDFKLANVTLKDLSDPAHQDLVTILREKIYRLILERFDDYLNLLYIIDVPENAFRHLKVTDVVEVADQVCFLILKREYEKVKLKSKYS